MKTLTGRTAVVTGAASGIGRAVAIALADKGCHVAIADLDEAGLGETAATLRRAHPERRVSVHRVDVARRDEMERFVADVEAAHHGADVLVNNAGVAIAKLFEEHSIEDFEWLLGINLWGVVYGCKLFLPLLKRGDEAHIVNLSSIFGIVGVPLNSAYCASKFAVRGLSETLRVELEEHGIGVTSVHPGGIATNIVARARWGEDADKADLRTQTVEAFKKMTPPAEAARQIVQAIERNTPRLVITAQAQAMDGMQRMSPGLTQLVMRRRWKRLRQTGILEV